MLACANSRSFVHIFGIYSFDHENSVLYNQNDKFDSHEDPHSVNFDLDLEIRMIFESHLGKRPWGFKITLSKTQVDSNHDSRDLSCH